MQQTLNCSVRIGPGPRLVGEKILRKRNPVRLGSMTQTPSEEAEKENQRPGLGKHLKQADGEKQLGKCLNPSQIRTNLCWLEAEQEPGRDEASATAEPSHK